MNVRNVLWTTRNIRAAVEAVARDCERLEAHTSGASPGLRDRVRLLHLDAQRLAERSRSVQHALEAELHDTDPLAADGE